MLSWLMNSWNRVAGIADILVGAPCVSTGVAYTHSQPASRDSAPTPDHDDYSEDTFALFPVHVCSLCSMPDFSLRQSTT